MHRFVVQFEDVNGSTSFSVFPKDVDFIKQQLMAREDNIVFTDSRGFTISITRKNTRYMTLG